MASKPADHRPDGSRNFTKRRRDRWDKSTTFHNRRGYWDVNLFALAEYIIDECNWKPEQNHSLPDSPIIDRGECVLRYDRLKRIFGWPKQRVSERVLELESRGWLKRRTVGVTQTVIVTVINYRRYQDKPGQKAAKPGQNPDGARDGTRTVGVTVGVTDYIIEEDKKLRREERREEAEGDAPPVQVTGFQTPSDLISDLMPETPERPPMANQGTNHAPDKPPTRSAVSSRFSDRGGTPTRDRRKDRLLCPVVHMDGTRCDHRLAWSEGQEAYYCATKGGGCGGTFHLHDWEVVDAEWWTVENRRYVKHGRLAERKKRQYVEDSGKELRRINAAKAKHRREKKKRAVNE